MTKFQEDLLNIRRFVIDTMRAQLMGPGSEVSYPDAENELISEAPSDRYSVGILYPQNQKFGYNDYTGDSQTSSEETDSEEDQNGSLDQGESGNEQEGGKSFSVYKDDSFDDEVNMAQQNKPSSMGLSFFVSGDLSSFAVLIQYAKYAPVKDGDIVIPYLEGSLNIPDCLTPYISFDEKTKTIKKLQSIKWRELNDLFEQNAIEDTNAVHRSVCGS